jgi:DNA invertase Pin-like site-specific DNA recombinase
MKAVGYIRVSTDEQAKEGLSLDAQEAKVRAYAIAKGWELLGVIKDEKGGKPGIQKIIKACQRKDFDVVIICKLDRMTRNVRDLGYLVQDVFEKSGVAFSSIADNFDTTTANGKLVLNILGSVAQWERDIISERTKEVLTHKRLVKRERAGVVPLGYDLADNGRNLIPNRKELQVVRQVKAFRNLGWSYGCIAKHLNQLRTPTKRGGKWRAWTVQYLTQNEIYEDVI